MTVRSERCYSGLNVNHDLCGPLEVLFWLVILKTKPMCCKTAGWGDVVGMQFFFIPATFDILEIFAGTRAPLNRRKSTKLHPGAQYML